MSPMGFLMLTGWQRGQVCIGTIGESKGVWGEILVHVLPHKNVNIPPA